MKSSKYPFNKIANLLLLLFFSNICSAEYLENLQIKKVLDGDRTRVKQLKLEPGDLQIFKGRFTLHRVTKIEGNKSRYMCIPAYVLDPWRVNTPEHSKAIYGKVLPIHLERNKERSDGLAD